jgi:hypothetical protein
MRAIRISTVLILSSLLGPAQTPPPTARIEGRVLTPAGEPIRGAQIAVNGRSQAAAITGDDGSFVLPDLSPGTGYNVIAKRTGFLDTRYTSTTAPTPTLTLEPDQVLKITIQMLPQAVITGRVTNQAGDPEVNATVQLQRASYVLGDRQLTYAAGADTNDIGEKRLAGLTAVR